MVEQSLVDYDSRELKFCTLISGLRVVCSLTKNELSTYNRRHLLFLTRLCSLPSTMQAVGKERANKFPNIPHVFIFVSICICGQMSMKENIQNSDYNHDDKCLPATTNNLHSFCFLFFLTPNCLCLLSPPPSNRKGPIFVTHSLFGTN